MILNEEWDIAAVMWTERSRWYDYKPYLKAFELEWMVLGRCPISELVNAENCGDYPLSQHRCSFIFGDDWYAAYGCGPLFVKKYNLKRRDDV